MNRENLPPLALCGSDPKQDKPKHYSGERFQFLLITNNGDYSQRQEEWNKLGLDGWEFCQIADCDSTVVFKRAFYVSNANEKPPKDHEAAAFPVAAVDQGGAVVHNE